MVIGRRRIDVIVEEQKRADERAIERAGMISEMSAIGQAGPTSAYVAIVDLKSSIVEKHHDLEATE